MGSFTIHNRTKRILQGALRGIKVDVIDYSQYPWIDAAIVEDGITLASPRDIAAMKINAIEGRGTCKDFIDIYFLLQHYTTHRNIPTILFSVHCSASTILRMLNNKLCPRCKSQ